MRIIGQYPKYHKSSCGGRGRIGAVMVQTPPAHRGVASVLLVGIALSGPACQGPDEPGDPGEPDDGFVATAELQPIPTVVRIRWTLDEGIDPEGDARVEVGLEDSYGSSFTAAPSEGGGYEALVWGLKAGRSYHYRMVHGVAGEELRSEDRTVLTGPAPSFLGELSLTAGTADAGPPGVLEGRRYRVLRI